MSSTLECNEIGDTQLNVDYKNNKIKKLCTNEREMRARRPDLEKKLRLRVKALEQAETLGDLPEDDPGGAWHRLKPPREEKWAGELSGNWRLVVDPVPLGSLGATAVTVVDVVDYH